MNETSNAHASENMPPDAPPDQPRSLRILLAEDDLINRKVVLHMLKTLGYTADCAINGQEAVEFATKQHYDIILMDMQMPVMDGLEAAVHLRNQNHAEAIVALTADCTEADRLAATRAGMDGFLCKPISASDLQAVLTNLPPHRDSH